ncbi:hypothetical protein ANN_28375 [Periplaneta americana]|uniref:Uncharacterized protein n=1 Tax=Periplaneta americana TaxID=6978 RepID=A0ABQ8TSC4_PERAM|nr:hypothetical protein ANN_28375 [Periplaneta americana]
MLLPFTKEARSRGQFAILVKDKIKINGKLYDLEHCQRNFNSQKNKVSASGNLRTREVNTEQPEGIIEELVRDGKERESQQYEVCTELKPTSETGHPIDELIDRERTSQDSAEPSGVKE